MNQTNELKKPSWLRVGVLGSIVAAICCMAPALVALFAAVGLGWFSGYLNYVIVGAVVVLAAFAAYTFWQRRRAATSPLS